MRQSMLVPVFLGVAAVSAGPVVKRQSTGLTDGDILNFALVLEHLESNFYSEALTKFNDKAFTDAGYSSDVRSKIADIAADEAQHVQFLTTALTAAGLTPVAKCQYSFPYDSVVGFLGVAQILEGVGVSAYLGAAQYVSNPAYLTAAGSILTAEARHSAYIRLTNRFSPFVTEDTPLDPTSVQSLATPFFKSCPDGSAPPFTAFQSANLTSTVTVPGSKINVSFANSTSASGLYCLFFSGLQTSSAPYADGSCTIPTANQTTGQAYGIISSSQTFNDSSVVAGPFILNFDTQGAASDSSNKGTGNNAVARSSTTGAGFKVQGSIITLVGMVAAAFGILV